MSADGRNFLPIESRDLISNQVAIDSSTLGHVIKHPPKQLDPYHHSNPHLHPPMELVIPSSFDHPHPIHLSCPT